MKFKYHITSPEMLRTFLQKNDYSKKTISAIKDNGALLVNGQAVTVRRQLVVNDVLEVHLSQEVPSSNLIPFIQPLNILYEDEYLLVVSKSAFQNCAPSKDHKHGSLVEQVLGYFNDMDLPITPHVITRLDRNTSGIVIFAKHGFIHHLMSQTTLAKYYYCICYGAVEDAALIDAPIGREPSSIIQRRVDSNGRQAQTQYKCLQRLPNYSLCKVQLLTGRTHQIRVHFQHIGHPLVGDDLYGGAHPIYKHQLLRCVQVSFVHPITHKTIEIHDKYDAIESIFNMI
ncbi:RluA family pseudouridine synthase [Staphylococcus succinus]|nr:RluA family pseudouridine synthase [Staphylococcus succinus]